MKKVVAFLGMGLALLGMVSCGHGLSVNDEIRYGSISVGAASSRSVSVDSITSAKVVVTGSGIDGELCAVTPIENGKSKSVVTVNNIPFGKNRIVSVYAYDENGQIDENEIVLRSIFDMDEVSKSIQVNRSTTALGNVFAYMLELGHNISKISNDNVITISNSIDSSKDCLLINSASIANDYIAGGVTNLKDKASYINGAGGANVYKSITVHAKYKYIWYWEGSGQGQLAEMTAEEDGFYTYTFEDKASMNMIFRPNGGNDWSGKTDDLSRETGNWYYENNTWTGSAYSDSVNPSVTWEYPSDGTVVTDCIHFIVSASDEESGIASVEFFVDGKSAGSTAGAFAWTFDSSNLSNGAHTVYAVVKDGAGNSAESETINFTSRNAEKAPKAVVDSKKTCTETISTNFDGSKSTGSIASYTWDFGDGSTGSGATVSHIYAAKGNYDAVLTVTSAGGLTDSATIKVTVNEKGSFLHRDFREETIYFMMTDRFADGDKTNNNLWGDEYLPNGESDMYKYDESKTGVLSYYHGGDYKGIIDNLDYIKDMGFTAIWITPSVKQPEGRYFYDGSGGGDAYSASAFHGYWGYDFDQIDPHLHSSGKNSDGWDDFKAFVDACHDKGIRVMQDIVINHGNHTAATAPTKWLNNPVQTIMDGKQWAYKTMDPYYDENNLMNGFYAYTQSWQCADLIDFGDHGEDGKDARQHMINVYKKFIDAGVDAFRIDTMAYITNEWAGEFADAMSNYAKELGNDYFYMFGEAWCLRYDAVARHSKDTTDSLHMIDMQLSSMDFMGQMEGVFKGGSSFANIESNIRNDDKKFACMTPKEYTYSGMFVDNHDKARMDGKFTETEFKNDLNFIYLFSGVPIVYYGTEAYYSDLGITHPTTNQDDVTARWMLGQQGIDKVKSSKPAMYRHLKALNELHAACETMKSGEQTDVSMTTQHAAFSRTCPDGKTGYYLLNIRDSSDSLSFDVKSGSYILYTMSGDSYTSKEVSVSGSYTLEAPANGFAILEPR